MSMPNRLNDVLDVLFLDDESKGCEGSTLSLIPSNTAKDLSIDVGVFIGTM